VLFFFLNENEIRMRYPFSVTKSHFEVHYGYNSVVNYNFAVVVDRDTLHVFPDLISLWFIAFDKLSHWGKISLFILLVSLASRIPFLDVLS
jgi:hypothetical protein